ncbi:GTP cyclohydrolase 1 [Labeo rohita]|uniref:GTP cyclohydrolase 1 n=2 Tax=Labeo rohita TaxID=84645 RepID=A0ABQ8M3H4_LABRO|nr:GTP cyclohydrolase 1 [Labeo rohita]
MALCQQGMGVGGLAQTFWTLVVGLELGNSELSKIFNDCLDNPLPPWEMEGLKTLDYWEFIDYLCYRILLMQCWSEPIAVPPEMSEPPPRRSSMRRVARSAPVVSDQVVLEDLTPVVSSLVVLEDSTLVVPSPVVLEDPTLVILEVTELPALFVYPVILPLLAPPRLLALPAPTKLLDLLAPPMLSALLTPLELPALLVQEFSKSTPEPTPVQESSDTLLSPLQSESV